LVSFHLPMKLQPGASVALAVTFTPTSKGYADGSVTLTSNDPQSPLNIRFHGTGFYPSSAELTLTPSSLNFGNVTVGSSATLQVTVSASGAAVTISSDGSNSSEFVIVGLTLPVTLQAGQSIPVTVQFTPNASGKASGKVGFSSNAVDSPTVEQVAGTGVPQSAHSVYLTWNAGDGNAVGYNVYRGTAQAGPFQEINTALDASTNYTDTTVASGTTYYYVATEVNAQGQESGYSNEVMAVVPSP
jgi:Abnormal spindle-like microcephaly-assoc'd, ASPM-SPD-2-Hydin